MNHFKLNKKVIDAFSLILCLVTVHFVIAVFTGKWPWQANPYNSYTLQACSWLEGRLDLGQNYEYLELAIFQGKYFVSFPPFPSYLLLPFAFLFDKNTPDGWIALVATCIGGLYALKLFWEVKKSDHHAIFWTLFLYVGTNILYISMDGWVWFIAQNLCLMFSFMSLYYAVKGKGLLSLLFWACSVGCRPFQVLYLPILLYLLYQKLHNEYPGKSLLWMIKKKYYWAIPTLLLAMSYMILNYARFGSISEFGHNYLPEFVREKTGQFHLSYLKENVKTLFRLPVVAENGSLTFFSSNGNAFWLVSPLFVSYILYWVHSLIGRSKKDIFLILAVPITISIHIFLLIMHRTMGGYHFGNRYINDTIPYLFLGLLFLLPTVTSNTNASSQKELFNILLLRLQYFLFFLGLCLNLVGTVAYANRWL